MERWEQIIENMELPEQSQRVYIWGAGNTSELNHQGMLRENLYKELRITAFLDSNLAGTMFHSFPVLHPDILNQAVPDEVFVLISTTNHKVLGEIENICKDKNIACCLLDAALMKLRRNEFSKTSDLFDQESKRIFDAVLSNRAIAGLAGPELYAGEAYFGIPEFCRPRPDDVVVDCGAYIGDSAERFIWRMEMFRRYVAIEPDAGNYHAMQRRFQRLREEWNLPEEKLTALHGGVDAVTQLMSVNSRVGGLGSIASEMDKTDGRVAFWALDDILPEGCTFLKADIESYEYRMLLGARNMIKKFHPRMAICIYHNMIDLYSIPQVIYDIDPGYRLAVRHHSYGYEETVLYAW